MCAGSSEEGGWFLTAPLRIGLAGLGTVGLGTYKILQSHGAALASRCGRAMTVTAVSARDPSKDRGVDLSDVRWAESVHMLTRDPDVDVVVEMIGGADGDAYDLVRDALENGKHVVTANKALIATHGIELAERAEAKRCTLAFEAAVAGGIPIIKALREGLVANKVSRIIGILNGTSNYILTTMEATNRPFDDVLADAQRLGYAEADPTFDIDGTDAAHKLSILSSIAFGSEVAFDAVRCEGIQNISPLDFQYAAEFGYKIKLLAIAEPGQGGLLQSVHPTFVPAETPMADIDDVYNAVVVEGDAVGRTVYEGRGAGEGPTASAVVADLADIARGLYQPVFQTPASDLAPYQQADFELREGKFYIRLSVKDRPGVIAQITRLLADQNVSLQSILQKGSEKNGAVSVVLMTHRTTEKAVSQSIADIEALDDVFAPSCLVRVMDE